MKVAGRPAEFSAKRSSKLAVLADRDQTAARLADRLAAATGWQLAGSGSEQLQVMNYGLGGTIQVTLA